jgi:predicted dehydrogenase
VSDRLTVTVVGAGAGGTLSIDALIASARYDLLAVADLGEAGRQRVTDKTNGAVATFESYQQMFDECPSDVVCISTWAPSHLEITTAALAIPGLRGLLVEKPLGDSVAAGAEILEIVRAAGLPLVVPHGLMAQAAALEVIDQVRAGTIGDLRVVEMECTGWDLINAGIHWLQFFVSLVQPSPITTVLTAADTSTRTFRDGMQVETEAVTMARTADGVRVLLNTGDSVPISRTDTVCLMRIVGSRGFIEFGAFEPYYTIVSPGHDRVRIDVAPFEISGHQRHLEYLADQIATGERDYRVPEASLEALRIVEAGYESHRRRGAVSLPLGVADGDGGDWDPGLAYSGSGGGRNGRDFS